jgi:hypothetical protein
MRQGICMVPLGVLVVGGSMISDGIAECDAIAARTKLAEKFRRIQTFLEST